jgi:hypothetical protein
MLRQAGEKLQMKMQDPRPGSVANIYNLGCSGGKDQEHWYPSQLGPKKKHKTKK